MMDWHRETASVVGCVCYED